MTLPIHEILELAALGWILEKISRNYRQYFNAKNPKQHKTIIDAGDPTATWQVTASSDDATAYGPVGGGAPNIWSTVIARLYFTHTTRETTAGCRWLGVPIPQYSTIASAYWIVKSNNAPTANPNTTVTLRGINEDNTLTFSTLADYNGRPRTAASYAWLINAVWVPGTWYGKANLPNNCTALIQEIVNRPGWNSGNALALVSTCGQPTGGHSQGTSWDSVIADAPKLEVTWTVRRCPVILFF